MLDMYVGKMENSNLNANQQKNQLPEADSLPDGFVDSSSAKPLAPGAPGPEQEVTSKEEKLVKSDSLAEVVVNDGTSTSQDKSLEIMGNQNDQAVTMAGSADAGASSGERHIEEKCNCFIFICICLIFIQCSYVVSLISF